MHPDEGRGRRRDLPGAVDLSGAIVPCCRESPISERRQRNDSAQRRRRECYVDKHAGRVHLIRHIPLDASTVPSGSYRGPSCRGGGYQGLHGSVWGYVVGVLDRYESDHHAMSNDATDRFQFRVLFFGLHGYWREQQLHFCRSTGYRVKPDIPDDPDGSAQRQVNSQQHDLNGSTGGTHSEHHPIAGRGPQREQRRTRLSSASACPEHGEDRLERITPGHRDGQAGSVG